MRPMQASLRRTSMQASLRRTPLRPRRSGVCSGTHSRISNYCYVLQQSLIATLCPGETRYEAQAGLILQTSSAGVPAALVASCIPGMPRPGILVASCFTEIQGGRLVKAAGSSRHATIPISSVFLCYVPPPSPSLPLPTPPTALSLSECTRQEGLPVGPGQHDGVDVQRERLLFTSYPHRPERDWKRGRGYEWRRERKRGERTETRET